MQDSAELMTSYVPKAAIKNVLAHRSTPSVRDSVLGVVLAGDGWLSARAADDGGRIDTVSLPASPLRLQQRRAVLAAMLLLYT